jgi:hypothetical protein
MSESGAADPSGDCSFDEIPACCHTSSQMKMIGLTSTFVVVQACGEFTRSLFIPASLHSACRASDF